MTSKNDPSVVALVPMRHHSARVEGKNYRMIAGRPLYAYILEALTACERISRIVVDTDSPVISEGIRAAYPDVVIIPRPAHLIAGEIPMNEILLHDIQHVDASFFLQTHSTNPLLRSETITASVEAFFRGWPVNDSLFSVTPLQSRLWTPEGRAVNHDPNELLPTQDLEPLLIENSCLYIFSREGLVDRGNRIGEKPILFEISAVEAVDIDTEWEFELAEIYLTARHSGNSNSGLVNG